MCTLYGGVFELFCLLFVWEREMFNIDCIDL